MSVSRERLEYIAEAADKAAYGPWKGWGHKVSLLASWVRDLSQAVAALDEGQERLEGDIGALSDAVDEIVDGTEPDELDIGTVDGIDLTAVPHDVDYNLEYNEARIIDGKIYVGSLFAEMLEAATEAAKESDTKQFGIGDVVRLARHDPEHGAYCIPAEVFFEVGTVLDGLDEYGDYRVMFGRLCKTYSVKPEMLDRVQAA
jgi:hypothetical protein